MRFGVREICEVVLKAKAAQKVGNKIFYKNEPVIYFDSLKTSTMEGAATTVYANGGVGNSRLIAWEGERTVTFTMEDALLSPASFMILSGAGLIEAGDPLNGGTPIYVHQVEQTDKVVVSDAGIEITVEDIPYQGEDDENYVYVMLLDNGEVVTEPYTEVSVEGNKILITDAENNDISKFTNGCVVLVDYYVEKTSGAQQIEITPDKFGGNYYLEASTLFRNTDGVDLPAEFIIPNCKIQSNFTFSMASSGDPSTFTFTMDAFPDYTRFNKTKKVLAAIQIVDVAGSDANVKRHSTDHARNAEEWAKQEHLFD
jgi:hypothetical protein